MSALDRFIKDGLKKLNKSATQFEQEYKDHSKEIERTKTEMEEWSKKRRIIRNK
ncbi:hypothetical protein H7B90_00930 [Cohnella xylanilytica]|uniref:Uncharacterized protein n=1 Tax=Cohnella xylanilytica TaxID=557555 RepID=A0A841TNQ1_9BACL|nr:hypothetical protein [Cohnella xylanilytica]MBB6689956.1 hypothetical protein [Cohnella xylanilytica]